MKSITLTKYLQVTQPEYVYLRIKPNNAVRNQGTYKIARAIAALHKTALANIKIEEHKLVKAFGREFVLGTRYRYTMPAKVGYYIYMEQRKVEFFFIVPRQHLAFLREKLSDVWGQVTIEEVAELPGFSSTATRYELVYEKEDAMSVATDRRNNDLLTSNLNAVELLEEGDKLAIMYNFIPTSQLSWRHLYKATIDKVNRRLPVDRNKMGTWYLFRYLIAAGNAVFKEIAESLSEKKGAAAGGDYMDTLLDRLNGGRKISESTTKKAASTIIDTQIVVMAESPDKLRERNAARSLAQSFDTVSEDNRLLYKPYRRQFLFTDRYLPGAEKNKVGDLEAQNFLELPGRGVLERYDFIDKVETQETQVPDDLKQGVMSIGTNKYRGNDQAAYLSTDKEYKNLMLAIIGPTRAGKSTLIGNLSRDAINAGESVFIFDFVKNCELSTEVSELFPKDKTLVIDCADPRKIQGLGFNEVPHTPDPFFQYDNAKKQTTQLMVLINSINADDTRLTAKMERYLTSAALVVFITGGSIKDVFNVLQNHRARHSFLEKVPKVHFENLEEYMNNLEELDEYKDVKTKVGKETIVESVLCGTKDHLITGVIDRLNKLKANTWMEQMLKKSTAGNIDLVQEIQKNQLICLKMPETMFQTDGERDIYTTYWLAKIWLALQIRGQQIPDRGKLTKLNVIIDELYQVENTEKLLTEKISRLAKFGAKPIISAHYLNQIRHIRDELRSANASYMLISGCDKNNYKELSSELYPYTEEDLLKLPRHHSLNLIKNKDGYARFITKLPCPIIVDDYYRNDET
ncbi:hypothetical protein PALU110988_27445 [Paenibacillus lupini]|uniref:hypothetical protein n=1 Tax=Paenibacillus lupini TaxID=1450204 RepID=UPI001ABA994D|nr:hypothetical protein [Paenibacillus lupini]NIK24219.1 hypothetical protein [Paenibacillus lupini]